MGKDWHFLVLENNTYAESKTFYANEIQDLHEIIAVLENIKQMAEKHIFIP